MARLNIILILLGLVLAATFVSAATDCAAKAYSNACTQCSFDAKGKVNQTCSSGFKSAGIACTSSSFPIMSGKYAAGQCPAVDQCAQELQSCVAQYSSGNDKADCTEGSVAICYSAADACTRSAAVKCGEVQSSCGAPAAVLLLGFVAAFFVRNGK